MKLNELRPAAGSHKPAKRLGRGHGSGRGKTAGRGTKGQKSRAGGNLPAWFEGGQTPLHIRTPKLHGFKNRGRVEYAPVNLSALGEAASGTLITPDVLEHDGILKNQKLPVKVLGVGEAPAGVTIHAHAFSKSALDKLAAAGSTVQRITWPDNAPVEEADATDEGDDAHDGPRADAEADAEVQASDPGSEAAADGGSDADAAAGSETDTDTDTDTDTAER